MNKGGGGEFVFQTFHVSSLLDNIYFKMYILKQHFKSNWAPLISTLHWNKFQTCLTFLLMALDMQISLGMFIFLHWIPLVLSQSSGNFLIQIFKWIPAIQIWQCEVTTPSLLVQCTLDITGLPNLIMCTMSVVMTYIFKTIIYIGYII